MSTILALHDPQTARRYYAEGHWREDTLYTRLRDHAAATPDTYALRDSRQRLTWSALLQWVDAVAADLHAAGLKRGQRVSVWLPNRVEGIVVFLACSRNGYVCNPSLHQNYTVAEVVELVQRISSAALFAQRGHGADGKENDIFAAAQALAAMKRVYYVGDPPSGTRAAPFPSPDAAGTPPGVDENPDKIVYLAFTSGTTGMPKGVLHSDNTLLANGRAMVHDWRHDRNTVLYSHSPLSHHIATVAIEQSLVAGFELVVNDLRKGWKPLDLILASGATYVMGVPTHAVDVLADFKRRGLSRLGKVNVFYMAGSVIPPEIAHTFLELGIKPQNIYGMTENSSHHYTHPDDDAETICATCGRGGRAYEVRIFDQNDADREVPWGTVGQIGGRGGALMLGYFGNQAATEQSFNKDGWFLSGDLGVLDERGNLRIVGRLNDVVIRGGYNIHPAKVEELAVKHPGIAKAAAFGVPDERLGEKLCLAISCPDGEAPGVAELLRHLFEAGLSKFDMPEYFIVLDEFPLTASGKILKRKLAAWAREGRIAPESCRFEAPPVPARR